MHDPYLYELVSDAKEIVRGGRRLKTNAFNEFLKDFAHVCELESTHWNLIRTCGGAIWSTKNDLYRYSYQLLAQRRKQYFKLLQVKEAGRDLFDHTRIPEWSPYGYNYDAYFDSATRRVYQHC